MCQAATKEGGLTETTPANGTWKSSRGRGPAGIEHRLGRGLRMTA
jgi:hypothetical protein